MNYRKSTTLPPISHLGNNNDINTVRYFLLKAFVTVGFNEHHVAILFFFLHSNRNKLATYLLTLADRRNMDDVIISAPVRSLAGIGPALAIVVTSCLCATA